jgi:hypothetical protein
MLAINAVDATDAVRRELRRRYHGLRSVRFSSASRTDDGEATWAVAGVAFAWEEWWPRRIAFCYLVDLDGRVFGFRR